MNTSSGIDVYFYRTLGKLFYAMAASDRIVRKEEVTALREMVSSKWLSLDDPSEVLGSDATHQMESVFDWLEMEGDFEVQRCWNDFVSFKRNQPQLFTDRINALIYRTAEAIAESYSNKNKSELILLNKLKLELGS